MYSSSTWYVCVCVCVDILCCVFCRCGTRGVCEMVSDGGGRFIPAYVVGVKHIIFITFVPGST